MHSSTSSGESASKAADGQPTGGQLTAQDAMLAVQGSSDGLWVWTVGTDEVVYSDRCAEMLGYSPRDFAATLTQFKQLLHPADADHVWAALDAHLEQGAVYDVRYRLRTARGDFVWIRARGRSFAATKESPRRMAGSIQDISDLVAAENSLQASRDATDERLRRRTAALLKTNEALEAEIAQRRQAEQNLRTSELKFHDLYEYAPDMYASVDPQTRTVVECNQTLLTTLGYKKSEVIGADLTTLYHPDCHPEMLAAFATFVETGEVNNVRLLLRTNHGEPLHVSLRVRAVRNQQGDIIHSRSAWRDVTERVRAERKLREQESQLTHVTRVATMGEMATGLAHELNQPLQSISSYAQGCIERMQSGHLDAELLLAAANTVVSEAQRASDIIGRLRSMVQRREVKLEAVDVRNIVAETKSLLQSELKKHHVTLSTEFPEDLPAVFADQVQFQQLLVNLFRNAIQAMTNDDSSRREIHVQAETPNPSQFALRVWDTGPGIPDDALSKLFNAFYTTREDGMGMGLSICRTIAESLAGTLTASNHEQGGAEFVLLLPIDDSTSTQNLTT